MSVEQYQRMVNRIDKEIADLEKKKAAKDKEYTGLQKRIKSTRKSIKKNTSASTRRARMRRIEGWESDAAKKSEESADLATKIVGKRGKSIKANLRLQKAKQKEQGEAEKQNAKVIDAYEQRIDELQEQIKESVVVTTREEKKAETDEYDLFISHAFEDKEDFVDELVSELRKKD